MATAPNNIRALRDAGLLEIQWTVDRTDRLPFKFVRGECRCAACVDEMTGVRILDVNTISELITPESMNLTGNYAIKIRWSDGHDTGLFTWETLEEIGRAFSQTNPKPESN